MRFADDADTLQLQARLKNYDTVSQRHEYGQQRSLAIHDHRTIAIVTDFASLSDSHTDGHCYYRTPGPLYS